MARNLEVLSSAFPPVYDRRVAALPLLLVLSTLPTLLDSSRNWTSDQPLACHAVLPQNNRLVLGIAAYM